MGSCCFTPKKTHFLWWYWLALASIIGIPMLLASHYVARRRAAGETDLAAAGRRAGRIFWGWSILFLILAVVLGCWLADTLTAHPAIGYSGPDGNFKYPMTLYELSFEFFCSFILASLTVRAARKCEMALTVCLITLFALGLWIWLSVFSSFLNPLELLFAIPDSVNGELFYLYNLDTIYPFAAALMFAACLAMAWLWRGFLDRPTPATSRRALAGMFVGTLLFFLAARYGNLAHFYLYHLARGHLPGLAAAAPYMMK